MYKILFLTFDWNYNIANEYNSGIQKFVEDHSDTNIYVFNGMGKYNKVDAENRNFEIFNIPELDHYDGVALQGNVSWPVEKRQAIADQCRDRGIPCVSINYPLRSCTYIGTDNYEAMAKMVSHLIVIHGSRRPYFVTGLAKSQEAIDRQRAFTDVCARYGIHEYRILEGNWNVASGAAAAEQILKEEHLPDALVCSNDDEAIGAMNVLKEHGIQVPQDILVTGFDNRDIGIAYVPRLTTVSRDYATILYTGMDALYRMFHGEKLNDSIYSPAEMKYEGTCGCCKSSRDERQFKQMYYDMDTSFKKYFMLQNYLHEDMAKSASIEELMSAFEKHLDAMQVNTAYLMIDKQYLFRYESEDDNYHYSHSAVMMASNHPDRGTYEKRNHFYDSISTAEVLPHRFEKPGGMLYMVYPVKSTESCIGWLVSEGVCTAGQYNTIQLILLLLSTDMEIVRKSAILKHMNMQLGNLYLTDQLTGLYNRFGMEHYGKEFFEQCMSAHQHSWICFIDIDDMKAINDRFGHELGDSALKDASGIIKEAVKDRNAFAMRYGGDEFLIISEESVKDRIRSALIRYHENEKRMYYLSLSVGEYAVHHDFESLNACIEQADEKMYEMKKKKKEAASRKHL
ncbi:MAG: GGDEF domain-containing protein [Solobacterium sp.]|nr:GGDEF domain-containing protein [Solobacterium sp.]MCH4204955.1 GGDEF domain-containing protein [Solobacterium sp.]MCH4226347.1 GGDEF domain-containing protein [Solobacterium sp.]MCH4281748.1 GGDEF domain-containing protein [Solobacterium sp.]